MFTTCTMPGCAGSQLYTVLPTFPGRRRRPILVYLLLLLPLLFSGSAHGQTGQGTITGKVTDAKGFLVPQAKVQVTNKDTGVTQTTKTNANGIYTVVSLNPATYTVSVSKPGFSVEVIEGVTLQAAAVASVDANLHVGGDNESITVTAQDSLLSKDTSDVTTTVDHTLVLSLPYPERSSLEAALLVPGVLGDPAYPGGIQSENPTLTTGVVTPGAAIGISGAPPGTASILVDGSDVTQASYPRAGVNLSGQVVQETTVITGGLSAKYGRTSGGSIVQTSRPGTNKYHGGITWRHTDPFFQAIPIGGTPVPPDIHENFYGFYLDGPVKPHDRRPKTFFFVGVEPARLRNTVGYRGIFFTPDDIAGHLNDTLPLLNLSVLKSSGYAAALAAPRTGSIYFHAPPDAKGFPSGALYGNSGLYTTVPGNDVSAQLAQNPFASFVMSLMPTPSNPGPYVTFDNANGTYANDGTNAVYKRGVVNQDNRYSIRIDHQFGRGDQIYGRYTVIPVKAERFFAVSITNPLNAVPTDEALTHNLAIGYTHIFSSAIVNNLRYSLLRVDQNRGSPTAGLTQDFGAKYGLTPATAGVGFPSLGTFNVSGVTYSLSPGTTSASQQIDQNFILGDDVTWTHGRNLFQFGADVRWIQSNQYNNGFVNGGGYGFAQSGTNNGSAGGAPLATFDLGIISSYTASPIKMPAYYRWHYYAGYFQDDFRATSRVTLNLGVRYNLETPRVEKFGNQPILAFNQPNTLNGLPTTAALCFANGCPGVRKTLWPINWKGVEPRVGISIATGRRTTVRGAYSLMHLPLTGYGNLPLPDLTGTPSIGGILGGTAPNQLVDYITNPAAPLVSSYQALNGSRGPILSSTGLSPIYVAQNDVVPYSQTWNLTIQFEPVASTLVQVTYQGFKGSNLIAPINGSLDGDMNQPSIETVTGLVRSRANLGNTAPACGSPVTLNGCNNPYKITQGGTVINESVLQTYNPYQNFFQQPLIDDFRRDGTSVYHGFLASVTHREGRNLSLLANYVWAKSMDDVANTTAANNAGSLASPPPQNPFDLHDEWSVSIYDQPSRLKVGYNYVLPIGHGQRFSTHRGWLDNLIGNLSTSGIYTVQSGFPNFVEMGTTGYFTSIAPKGPNCAANGNSIYYCTAAAFPTGYTLRPDRVPGVPLINKNWKRGRGGALSSTFVPYINPDAFTAPGSLNDPKLGNARRTLPDARSPRETFFDARVAKGFHIHERYLFNVTGTFSNAFNHPVYLSAGGPSKALYATSTVSQTLGTITNNPASTTFGQVSGGGLFSRVIRIGAELTF